MKKLVILTFLLLHSCSVYSQNRNAIWCFGDSAGIDFKNGTSPISTGIDGRGSCVAISDTSGALLFYAATSNVSFANFPYLAYVFDSTHNLMLNGDSIRGTGWYKELVILPLPDDSMKYYLFSIGVTSGPGFSYSIIDMTQNGGLGAVIQKNVLLESFNAVDCMEAVKHGNGRDWWVALRDASSSNNEHYIYLVSPSGVSLPNIQNVGSVNSTNAGRYAFSPSGDKLAFINYIGLLEIYDFDRCTGIISNPLTIHPEPTALPIRSFWSCEFSLSGQFLYVCSYLDSASRLFQYDLQSVNPVATIDTLDYSTNGAIGNGFLRRGPDNKIYISHAWECNVAPYCYPYPDSVYNYVNMNLSVINYPDSLGTACGYAPFSFYLGGKRTYYGLPNNPDYDLPALIGSPCDTLVSINEPAITNTNANLYVYYAPDWEKAFINADKLKGKQYRLRMVDVLGKEVYSESGVLNSQYFTRDLNCASFASGIYLITFETDKERLVKKMQVNWR